VFWVILDTKVLFDDLSDPSGSPQFIGEAVSRCPLQKELFQFG
jgi:hypothetical protein